MQLGLIPTPPPQKAMDRKLPRKAQALFRTARRKILKGGRGSAKSQSIARALVLITTQHKKRVLCAREWQNSMRESVHKLLVDQIDKMELTNFFTVTERGITCNLTESEFLFAGIRRNIQSIKSMEAIDICWVEEASGASKLSIEILEPTIRAPGSEIWYSYNPDEEDDPIHVMALNPPPDTIVVEMNWRDNPWFPPELKAQKDWMARTDPDTYQHVWEGKCRANSAAQIFKGKYIVEAVDPVTEGFDVWDGPYFGADWGFSQDPTCLIKCWIRQRKLYIQSEMFEVGLETIHIPGRFKRIAGADRHTIRADSARPETINYVSVQGGLDVVSVDKWPGSVEDGVEFMRSFEQIIIDPSCAEMIQEFRLYSYKVDRLTGDILTDIVDKNNHGMDAVRYALAPIIMNTNSIFAAL